MKMNILKGGMRWSEEEREGGRRGYQLLQSICVLRGTWRTSVETVLEFSSARIDSSGNRGRTEREDIDVSMTVGARKKKSHCE